MSSVHLRKSVLTGARRVVVKLGTQLLSQDDGRIDRRYLRCMARQVVDLRSRRMQVTLVVSGAVGEGCKELALTQRPRDVAELQAVAAVGQPRLMVHMHEAFAAFGVTSAQVLLTRGDFDDRIRFLNIRNCLRRLHRFGCVPIINENDAVAVEELEAMRLGENDLLAAMICNSLRADALILLTVVEGLLDQQGHCVELVEDIGQAVTMVRQERSAAGKGGMVTKLEAARLVTGAGEMAVIAHGRRQNVLLRLFDGEPLGTLFVPSGRKMASRSRWIGLTKRPTGTVTVDSGAAQALRGQGRSLLAIGITEVNGRFERGDLILLRDARGQEIGRGLTNYEAGELAQIMGKRSNQFASILGHPAFTEVVHRDNMVISR